MSATPSPSRIPTGWIRTLAKPYLRGYGPVAERAGSLRGYWFLRPGASRAKKPKRGLRKQSSRTIVGFFVGYLLRAQDFAFLSPEVPECLVFVSVQPLGGPLHRRLVRRQDSMVRETFEYIGWLTHRPPRFAFYGDHVAAMVRRQTMRDWPREKYEHFSRSFFIETLAWLVRSGLVRALLAEGSQAAAREGRRRRSG